MTELEFLQQLYLLKSDIEATPMLDTFDARQRERWAARLGDLVMRRSSAREQDHTDRPEEPKP